MLKFLLSLLLAILLTACQPSQTPMPSIVPGVSEELAHFRAQQIDSILYDLNFDIPAQLEDSIPSQLKLSFYLKTNEAPLVLDFQPNHDFPIHARINGMDTNVTLENEHLVFPKELLKKGGNDIELSFIAGERSLNRNKEYLFTLLVPDRARTLFPCFDQPNLKARYRLQVSTPNDWKVMGPSKLEVESVEGERKLHRFGISDPMSTYLFSFVAGTFEVIKNGEGNFPMTLFHMETDTTKTALSISQLFRLHQQSKDFLESYTESEFPFQKMDFAAIYSHPYGGMEHVGAIQYLQQSLFLDSTATESQLLGRAKLIAHETAHMWFGDLVTMKWFDDVWMKEVFANFLAAKIVNPIYPEIDHSLQFLVGHYPAAFDVDRTSGANSIRQSLRNLNNAGSLYGNIIYFKAPIMMRQLEALLGEEVFRKGLVAYMKAYPYGNADWNDLVSILDQQTPMDLKTWSDVWVHTSGRPIFKANLKQESDQIQELAITQEPEDGIDRIWPQVFKISLHYQDTIKILSVKSSQKRSLVEAAKGLPIPLYISYNIDGMGYGVFPLSDISNLPLVKDDVTRAQGYINLYENCLNGGISLQESVAVFQYGLQEESNELILGLITGYVRNLYWTYSSPEFKKQLQPLLERELYDRLQKKEAANIKKTVFELYKSIAHNGPGLQRLHSIWKKEVSIPNLNLNKDDFTSLAMTLVLYNHPETENILAIAEEAIDNDHKLERFQFLKPALSNNPEVRSEFFKSFAEEKNREKERWVSSACYYIHHPLRHEESIKEVGLSLELLEEIQATGDIFFPKSWLENTIGQYHSKAAWELTEKFLESRPEMDSKLRAKILQSTDDLHRAVQNQGKFDGDK